MTIQEAFNSLVASDAFKNICKEKAGFGNKCRVYLSRFNSGNLGTGAMVEILLLFGYTVTVKGTAKKPKAVSNVQPL